MTDATARRDTADRIAAALLARGQNLVEVGPSRWSLELRNGKAIRVRADLGDRWLTLATRLDWEPESDLPWRLLQWNGTLPPGCRLTLAGDGQAVLRAEVSRGECAVPGIVPAACDRLAAAIDTLHSRWDDEPPSPDAPVSDTALDPRWFDCLAEAGWTPKELPSLGIGLEFTERGEPRKIRITRSECGIRVAAELARGSSMPANSKEALGTLLLCGTGPLHAVRATAHTDDKGAAARVEMVVPDDGAAPEAEFAVGGVVLAVRQFGREAGALVHPPHAAAYLETISRRRSTCSSTQAPALICSK